MSNAITPTGTTSSPRSPEGLMDRPVRSLSPFARSVVVQGVAAALLGALAGALWNWVVDLPGYTVGEDGVATMSERQLVGLFTVDYWFSVIGLLVGLLLGVWAWMTIGRRGWWVVVVAVLTSALAGIIAWRIGEALGPQHFEERLGRATQGQVVPVDFALSAHSALAMWPLGAVIPIMIASAFLPEPDDLALRRLRRRTASTRIAMPDGRPVQGPQA